MPWAAAAAAVGAIGGAYISSQGAKSAANTQAAATRDANNTQLQMYNQTRADNMPALNARNDALSQLQFELGVGGNPSGRAGYGALGGPINPGDVTKEQGYGFGMEQGQRTLNNALAARGMRDSGAALMAATRYGNDYATTKYDDAFNRTLQSRNQQINPLLSLAGAGQIGTSQIGQAGMNSANQIGANQVGLGNALGASQVAQSNAYGSAFNQLAGIGQGWYQNRQNGQMPSGWASGPQSSGWYNSDVYGPQ